MRDHSRPPSPAGRQDVRGGARPPRAKKSLGQRFLADPRVRRKILDAAQLGADDTALEIGPGRGYLTRGLAERAGRVIAVEIDSELIAPLRESLGERGNVEVVEGDARDIDLAALLGDVRSYKVVANLPYYAATPIVRRFLEAERKPSLLVVMLQREVAMEMTAAPGRMSVLSVATQVYGRAAIVATVPPSAFRPRPKVSSAVVRIETREAPSPRFQSSEEFFGLVKAGFSAPRKQIHNNLKRSLDMDANAVAALLRDADIDPERRAQTLSLGDWGKLYDAYVARA